MKKTSILIAMFAVMAAASATQAAELVDFDGKLKPQTMHDIFANAHQFIPAPKLSPVETQSDLPDSYGSVCPNAQLAFACSPGEHFSALTCKCEPGSIWQDDSTPIDWNSIYQYIQTGNQDYCVPMASGPWWAGCVVAAAPVTLTVAPEIPSRSFMEMSAAQKKLLTIQYILQSGLKNTVISHATTYKFSPETVKFVSDAKTKILYDNKGVYITNGQALIVITDETLITAAKNQQAAVSRRMGGTRELATIIAGAGVIIGCMSSSDCWGTVGDTVSDISETITHNYYTNGPGAGQQQGWDDMPD